MKKYLIPSIRLTAVMILICCLGYFLLVSAIGKLTPGGGGGEKVMVDGKVVGYANVGQTFTDDKYFQGRPSAVGYNAAGSGGSNKGPSNPDYLKVVQERIDSFLAHNPGVQKSDIPAELVTASGSGLDPHLSPEAAIIQVKRVAAKRSLTEDKLNSLVDAQTEKHLFGPDVVNVLKLNIALDNLK